MQQSDILKRYHQTVADYTPTADDGILRILSDEELDDHPNPESVLQSWLDTPRTEIMPYDKVERAILTSRHCTEKLLRQLLAEEVMAHSVPETAAPVLLDHCGDQPERWASLLKALKHIDRSITFDDFLRAIGSRDDAD